MSLSACVAFHVRDAIQNVEFEREYSGAENLHITIGDRVVTVRSTKSGRDYEVYESGGRRLIASSRDRRDW